jgi:hypothetical protein
MDKQLARIVIVLALCPLLTAQMQILPGVFGPSSSAASGSFTYVQQVNGDQTNESATCGTDTGATTCIVPGTFAAGHLALAQIITGNRVTVSSAGALGTYVGLGGLDSANAYTNTSSTYKTQMGYILPTSGTTNTTFTFSGAHGGATISITDCSYSSGTPGLDAYGAVQSVSGSPYNGPAESTTGTSLCESILGTAGVATVSNITAISSPWNTNESLLAQFYPGLGNSNNGFSSLVASSYSTPAFTASGNTNANADAVVFQLGGTASKDWLMIDEHGGTNGSVPAQADLNASSYGYIGGGNTGRSPAWNGVTSGATGLTYAAPACGTPLTIGSKHYAWGGTTEAGAVTRVFAWATGSATHGQIPYAPPTGATQIAIGGSLCTTIPTSENSGTQYSLGNITNGTDEINLLIRPNGGTSLPLLAECNAVASGTVANLQPNTEYWFTLQMQSTVSGTNSLDLYASDGVTQIGSVTCTNTTAAQITGANVAGISGGETQASGHIIEYCPCLIDRTGATFPLLPGS